MKYDVAIIGDYNIGGDAWASRILLEDMGLRVVAQWSGDGTLSEMEFSASSAVATSTTLKMVFLNRRFTIRRTTTRRLRREAPRFATRWS